MSDVSALILAGGKATRFGGIAKHELVVDGEMIFARQVQLLAPRVAEILVSCPTLDGPMRDVLDRAGIPYRSVHDAVEGAGPLAGIAAGLAACRTGWLLVMAGDMPHVTGDLIDAMIAAFDFADISSAPAVGSTSGDREAADSDVGSAVTPPHPSSDGAIDRRGDDVDAVGVRSRGLPEPLLSLLHVRTRPVIERAIAAGRFKASRLLTDEGLRVRWLDAEADAVRNINSPEDLAWTPGSK